MEPLLIAAVGYIELGLNVAAVFIITVGAVQAFYGTLRVMFTRAVVGERRQVWSTFARWLVMALEFELAADLLRTIVAPTWADLGSLAAIAAIRTFLNYFLERDIDYVAQKNPADGAKSSETAR
jgi:uncharacterized membrane protein